MKKLIKLILFGLLILIIYLIAYKIKTFLIHSLPYKDIKLLDVNMVEVRTFITPFLVGLLTCWAIIVSLGDRNNYDKGFKDGYKKGLQDKYFTELEKQNKEDGYDTKILEKDN